MRLGMTGPYDVRGARCTRPRVEEGRSVLERRSQRRELLLAPREGSEVDRGAVRGGRAGRRVLAVGLASPLHLRERHLRIAGRPLLRHLDGTRQIALVEHALEIVRPLMVVFVHRR